jgi:hypothetical protein
MGGAEALAMVLLFSIPVLGIIAGVVTKWLKLRAEQRALGVSNRELEDKIERLERVSAEYAQRFENLEAIVVSRTWSALQEPGLSEADRERRLAAAGRHELQAPAAEERNRQRAAELARRLGG